MPGHMRTHGVDVLVPATSANLGPGFDCLGLAIGVHDRVTAMVTEDPGVLVHIEGEGEEILPRDDSHLVARAMLAAWSAMGVPASGAVLTCVNAIPQGRGMGSSAAAIVAGLLLGRALVTDGEDRLSAGEVFDLATRMEGHPDNVAAALFGGFTTAWIETPGAEDVHARAVSHRVHPEVVPVVVVPPVSMPTHEARRMLPDLVARDDAVFNVGRSALLVHALTADPSLLMSATEDRLHQDARAAAYPRSHELVAELRAQGIPAVISGAGPSVLALAATSTSATALAAAPDGWEAVVVPVDTAGARVHIYG